MIYCQGRLRCERLNREEYVMTTSSVLWLFFSWGETHHDIE